MQLTLTSLKGIPLVKQGDDLSVMILESLQIEGIELQNSDVIVLAQKIVSKAEGRCVHLDTFIPSDEAIKLAEASGKDPRHVQAIIEESRKILRAVPNVIIAEHNKGFICANAGIDHSNVKGIDLDTLDDWVLLLPKDSDSSAAKIRVKLETESQKRIAVLIIDSHGRPWRQGTIGMTIGVSGMPALVDLRGKLDLFGRELQATQVAAADELAAAASLIMGQADEASPVVHARGFPYALRESGLEELIRPESLDLFR